MSRAYDKALEVFPVLFSERNGYDQTNLQQQRRNAFEKGYEAAMAEIEEKIAQVKKNGTWDGIDVDEFMREVRGE